MDTELKFEQLQCCDLLMKAVTTHEEAMETTLPDYCATASRILDAAGQLLVREKQPGAYAWIVTNGLDKLRPFVWTMQSGRMPCRCYADGDNETSAVRNEYPVRISRRRRPVRHGEPCGVLRCSYSALRRKNGRILG